MNVHRRRTYWANIYVGLQEGYDGPTHEMAELLEYCGNYCRKVDTTVSVTTTVFMYSKGCELGAIIGLIHAHSRRRKEEIRRNALKLAKALLGEFNQTTVSVVFPDETVVFENRQGWKPRQRPLSGLRLEQRGASKARNAYVRRIRSHHRPLPLTHRRKFETAARTRPKVTKRQVPPQRQVQATAPKTKFLAVI